MAQKDLISFSIYCDKFFEVVSVHEKIFTALQKFMRWEIKKLILETPPRSGKSRWVQEAIAWGFGNLINTDVIYTWHTVWLLEWFSRSIRDRVGSPEYQSIFPAKIKSDNWAVNDWSLTNNNRLMIYWVGWAITGKWWHQLFIDDPYATRQDAESETVRKRVEEWYYSTFLSRRHSENSWICIIMQRWREDDLVWHILSTENDWEVVTIPAIENWESFWPSRFSVEYLEWVRKNIGEYFFQSQYMQDPINLGGWDFNKDYFQYYEDFELPKDLMIYTFIDPAISQKQEADYTAIVTVWLDKRSNNIYVLNVFRERVLPNQLIDSLFEIVRVFHPIKVWIEVVQYQKMLALEIKNQMRLRDRYFTLEEITPRWEKEARIRSILQPRYSNHSILHNKGMNELELELLKFPNWKHDDMIDALAWVIAMFQTVNISIKQTTPRTFFNRATWKMETIGKKDLREQFWLSKF